MGTYFPLPISLPLSAKGTSKLLAGCLQNRAQTPVPCMSLTTEWRTPVSWHSPN